MNTKLVINVFRYSFSFVMLLSRLKSIFIVLDSLGYGGGPVFDGRHTFLS